MQVEKNANLLLSNINEVEWKKLNSKKKFSTLRKEIFLRLYVRRYETSQNYSSKVSLYESNENTFERYASEFVMSKYVMNMNTEVGACMKSLTQIKISIAKKSRSFL